MYFLNYNTGASRWLDKLDLKFILPQFQTGSIVNIIDAENKQMMIVNKDGLAWVPIIEVEVPTDEEIAQFNEKL